jgi:hypothetical protein
MKCFKYNCIFRARPNPFDLSLFGPAYSNKGVLLYSLTSLHVVFHVYSYSIETAQCIVLIAGKQPIPGSRHSLEGN